MLFAFVCIDKPNTRELRSRLRAPHIEYMLRVKDRTVFGGPIQEDDGETSCGSIFAIEFASRGHADAFIADEPYHRGGLFETVMIRRWRQMVPEIEEGFLLEELERERAKSISAGETSGA